ncbi:hypothetical protein [Polaromonas sp.]|uniref:hypothetical protein n=1 Tax=Polaromonas sp. TaxID=1869339 RepID=UPI0032636ECF
MKTENTLEAGIRTPEMVNFEVEVWKAQLSYSASQNAEMLKAVLETGQTALKSALLINGGAAAALLALFADWLKTAPSAQSIHLLTPLGEAWLMFMWGLGAAGVATATRYLSQGFYKLEADSTVARTTKIWHRCAVAFVVLAVLCGASSYALFFVATHKVYSALGTTVKRSEPIADGGPIGQPITAASAAIRPVSAPK